ncbi:hypothetical protein C8R44DRAFT_823065 [Mycena epipterygia]|nr:hypothetical protein C8R44DRAFT_823065 [Mycena epipterygia]
MHFSAGTLFLISTLSLSVLGRPVGNQAPFSWSLGGARETQCFTQHAAPVSDCQYLLSNLPTPDWTNVGTDSPPIFKPFCSGSCCLFTDTPDVPTDELLSAGATLMGCREPANGLINGVTKTDTSGVCLADTTGANGCL